MNANYDPHTTNVLAPDDAPSLEAIRAKLANSKGKKYWKSLNEVADTPEFREFVEKEFPLKADWPIDDVSRRGFLKVMGASFALAGLTNCARQPREMIVPYVIPPVEATPGKSMYYATASTRGGFATGVLAESHLGRPTKLEGMPNHPSNLGGLDVMTQATVLGLYDPDRSQANQRYGAIVTWAQYADALRVAARAARAKQGAGFRLLTERVTSPTLRAQIERFLDANPGAKWHQYESISRDNTVAGAQLAFGEAVESIYHLDRADIVVSLDSDFLIDEPGSLRYARDFAARREAPHVEKPAHGGHGGAESHGEESGAEDGDAQHEAVDISLNRLYVVESAATLTGGMADHRLPLKPSQIESFARALAQRLGVSVASDGENVESAWEPWLSAMANDLEANRGRGLVVAGEYQPPIVHAIAHAINGALDNAGSTVEYIERIDADTAPHQVSLKALVDDINAGEVDTLVTIGANPAYSAPSDVDFSAAMKKLNQTGESFHLGLYADETAVLHHWHAAETHYLEAWGDVRGHDGTVSIVQPIIKPLYNGKSAIELMSVLVDETPRDGREIVRSYWQTQRRTGDFEPFWRKTLSDGVVADSAFPALNKPVTGDLRSVVPAPGAEDALEIVFRPDPAVYDGRYANNGWLQELPKPITKLTWENAVLVSPVTAAVNNVVNYDVVELKYGEGTIQGAVLISPGQPPETAAVYLGYGRRRAGNVGTGLGFDANALRTSGAPWFGSGASIRKLNRRYTLAITEEHHPLDNREADELAVAKGAIRQATVSDYSHHTAAFQTHHEPAKDDTLYPPDYTDYDRAKWGMTIDLNQCTGCNACALACQSENNIPVVGREEVLNGREMNWIRVDRYYTGDFVDLEIHHQPVPCMQCENAPCEVVCPVGATQHSKEGLNDMVYNRCIGTRYCSNNCPYKVRRFNFYHFAKWAPNRGPSVDLQRNPNVTVRGRGVMEKCTYCVQRINAARIEAKKEGRLIQDGEVVTACQAACPSKAIVFGNLNDPTAEVTQKATDARNYTLLGDLNTRPRTTYLGRLRNPNPELAAALGEGAAAEHEA